MATCISCGVEVAPHDVIYSAVGSVLCPPCHKIVEWWEQVGRAVKSVKEQGGGFSSGRPPVVHPVTACGGCNVPIKPPSGCQYSMKTLRHGKLKVLCWTCDKTELAELAAIQEAQDRQSFVALAVVGALAIAGWILYKVLSRS